MAFVNSTTGVNSNVTSFSLAAFSCTTGNFIAVLWTSQEGGGGDTVTCSDSAGNTYTGLTIRAPGSSASAKIFYAYNITGSASNVITLTIGVSRRYMAATALQFSGMDTTSGVFVGESGSTTSGVTTISAGSISSSGNTVALACFSSSNDRTWTAGSGYTEVGELGGSHMTEYQIGTASSYNPDATASGTSSLTAAAAVFKEAASGVSGTIAITSGNDTMSASGNVGVRGTIAITSGNDTLAATGTTSVQGTIAITNGNDTLAASGSVGSPVSGTVTITSGDDTLAAAGTTTVVGTVAITSGNDTLSAAGNTQILGTVSITNGDDSLSASGSVGSAVGGTVAIISGNDTLAAVGNVGIRGTIAITNGNDSMAAVGNVGVRGTIAIQNGNDSMSASGYPGSPPVGGLWRHFGYFLSRLGF